MLTAGTKCSSAKRTEGGGYIRDTFTEYCTKRSLDAKLGSFNRVEGQSVLGGCEEDL